MALENYIQKLDLRETFTNLSVKVSMFGRYKNTLYTNYPILNMRYDLSAPVDLYVGYDKNGNISDGYLYFESRNFVDNEISFKRNNKLPKTLSENIPQQTTNKTFNRSLTPQEDCFCKVYVGKSNFFYWKTKIIMGLTPYESCVSTSNVAPGVPADRNYILSSPTVQDPYIDITPSLKTKFSTDVVLPLFDNKKLSLFSITSHNQTSLLTNRRLWAPNSGKLNPYPSEVSGKNNQLEMILPSIGTLLDMKTTSLNFNVELAAFNHNKPVSNFIINPKEKRRNNRKIRKNVSNLYTSGNEYVKENGENYVGWYHIHPQKGAMEGKIHKSTPHGRLKSIKFISPIEIVKPTNVKDVDIAPSQTFYVPLTQSEVESGVAEFNFNSRIPEFKNYNIISSNMFIIENDEHYKMSLCNFLKDDVRELPYNTSRVVYNGKITKSSPYYTNGVKKFPLSWPVDLSNNEIFSDCNQCIEYSFYSPEHRDNFNQILKQNQIANLETDYYLNTNQQLEFKPRFFTGLDQWVERSTSDIFSDLQIKRVNNNVESLKMCPSKDTLLNAYGGIYNPAQKKCTCQFSDSTDETVVKVDVPSLDGDCAKACTDYQKEYNWEDCWTCEKVYSAPIGNLYTDFLSTTYAGFKETFTGGTVYSAYTNTGTSVDNTYDIYIEKDVLPSTQATIPISSINRAQHHPLVNVKDPRYVPYYSQEVFSGNGGNLLINTGTPRNYMQYQCKENGIYRFQYNAYLDVSYEDSKWADYVMNNYQTGSTVFSAQSYPTTDYELKRLIGASILRGGLDEPSIVLQDTDGKNLPPKGGYGPDSGLTVFNLKVLLKRINTANTETLLDVFSVSNDPVLGAKSDAYLTQYTNKVQNTFSGYSTVFGSGATGNTVFKSSIPINIDSGLISLSGGDKVKLSYEAEWSGTSKVVGGEVLVKLNLGHRIDLSGNSTYSPSYRVSKFDEFYVKKNLYFNAHKKSSAEKYIDEEGIMQQKSSQGALYTVDTDYSPITVPKVNDDTFNSLKFIDNQKGDKKLELNFTSNKPTNEWAKQLVNNSLEDYYLPTGNLINLNQGNLTFNLHRYDQNLAVKCSYKFPQINHSYVVRARAVDNDNMINNFYVIFTPSENLYVPCFTPPIDEQFALIQGETYSASTVQQFNNNLQINGADVIIKPSSAGPITTNKVPNGFKCQFYCTCKDTKLDGVDPYFGTTSVITDNSVFDCSECEGLAQQYCSNFNKNCTPHVYSTSCQPDSITNPQQTNFFKWTCMQPGTPCTPCTAEFLAANPGVDCPYSSCTHCEQQSYFDTSSYCPCTDSGSHRYNCGPSGDCIIDNEGPYFSLEECEDRCSTLINPGGNTNNSNVGNYATQTFTQTGY